ncbi:MAG TPA: aminopeptidase P family protein [Mycobacteriales bacterium]|nr:aminopeptidase P family protein [Mycobacteriales bacterium]
MADPDRRSRTSYDLGFSSALDAFMLTGWAERNRLDETVECAPYTAKRRSALSAAFPGELLVLPTGRLKIRSNDTPYDFRPGSDFFYFTGDPDPGAVLVLVPSGGGHDSVLFRTPVHSRAEDPGFYKHRQGEFWEGRRRSLAEAAVAFGLECRPLDELDAVLGAAAGHPVRLLPGLDASVDAAVPAGADARDDGNDEFAAVCSELRLIKDDFELAQLTDAVAATVRGFQDIVRSLPDAVGTSERMVEGVFATRARLEGNGVGYGTIAAAGAHATTLHWGRNDGPVRPGELLLVDAGVENRWLYTADVTRTIPVSGRFSPEQRRVYELVLAAQEAGLAAVRPGARFRDYHFAAMEVMAHGLEAFGVLPKPAADDLGEDSRLYRRWTIHGSGHMLGLDVHDCARARGDRYPEGRLEAGMVLTVEPGLYFQPDDLTVPPELRGIGVRIEDDVLVTPAGMQNLSAALPREPDAVEAWVRA